MSNHILRYLRRNAATTYSYVSVNDDTSKHVLICSIRQGNSIQTTCAHSDLFMCIYLICVYVPKHYCFETGHNYFTLSKYIAKLSQRISWKNVFRLENKGTHARPLPSIHSLIWVIDLFSLSSLHLSS
jgi:hypothetical protein